MIRRAVSVRAIRRLVDAARELTVVAGRRDPNKRAKIARLTRAVERVLRAAGRVGKEMTTVARGRAED